MALETIQNHDETARTSGRMTEDDNGNGSLMRMLPAAIWFHGLEIGTFLTRIHEISAITHAHPRTLVGCGIYSLLVRELLFTNNKLVALRTAVSRSLEFYNAFDGFKNELKHFSRILSGGLPLLEECAINSSGYIVDTLEASIWCFLRFDDIRSIIIAGVNLGIDTDTTGSIAGGLGGLVYGTESIPPEWLSTLAQKDRIDTLIDRFVPLVRSTAVDNDQQ
jgi:ADP-ribosylglycohydrolase